MENINGKSLRKIASEDKNAVVLDVRTNGEVNDGMIEGAKQIDLMSSNFIAEITKLDKSKTYLVYCRSGNRSGQACSIMEQMGFEKVYNLSGGMMSWDGKVTMPN